jgi:hypothetical protein
MARLSWLMEFAAQPGRTKAESVVRHVVHLDLQKVLALQRPCHLVHFFTPPLDVSISLIARLSVA